MKQLKNKKQTKFYNLKVSNNEAEIFIYEEISYFGVNADDFVKEINALNVDHIKLRINSNGGNVFDGLPIHNALVRHKAKVTTYIDGLAASIASIIALAGDEINIVENGFFMIHNASALAIGDADDMRHTAGVLEKITDQLVGIYVDKTGKDKEEIKDLMDKETWFNATESVEFGLAHNKVDANDEKMSFDLSVFNNVPEALKNVKEEPPKVIKEFESLLRDQGYSRSQATAIASKGFNAIHGDHEGQLSESVDLGALNNAITALQN